MVLGSPGSCLRTWAPSLLCVWFKPLSSQRSLASEASVSGWALIVFPFNQEGKQQRSSPQAFHAKLPGSTCHGTGVLEHLCLLDGNWFSLGSCQSGQQELVICFSCGQTSPNIVLFSKPDLSGSWKTGAFQDFSIYAIHSCPLCGQDQMRVLGRSCCCC